MRLVAYDVGVVTLLDKSEAVTPEGEGGGEEAEPDTPIGSWGGRGAPLDSGIDRCNVLVPVRAMHAIQKVAAGQARAAEQQARAKAKAEAARAEEARAAGLMMEEGAEEQEEEEEEAEEEDEEDEEGEEGGDGAKDGGFVRFVSEGGGEGGGVGGAGGGAGKKRQAVAVQGAGFKHGRRGSTNGRPRPTNCAVFFIESDPDETDNDSDAEELLKVRQQWLVVGGGGAVHGAAVTAAGLATPAGCCLLARNTCWLLPRVVLRDCSCSLSDRCEPLPFLL